MVAGTHGYYAFLRGKQVPYLDPRVDQHTEWFPVTTPARGETL